jgi:hypothetical protein
MHQDKLVPESRFFNPDGPPLRLFFVACIVEFMPSEMYPESRVESGEARGRPSVGRFDSFTNRAGPGVDGRVLSASAVSSNRTHSATADKMKFCVSQESSTSLIPNMYDLQHPRPPAPSIFGTIDLQHSQCPELSTSGDLAYALTYVEGRPLGGYTWTCCGSMKAKIGKWLGDKKGNCSS